MEASIVIPTYNRLHLLTKCLDAILAQTITREAYEIVVVDDCSSDDTRKFLEEISEKHTNVRYIRNNVNRGRSATRNRGILTAKGKIIILLDNDNIACRDFIEAHLYYHKYYGFKHIAVVGNPSFDHEIVKSSNFGKFLQSRYLGLRRKKELSKIDLFNLPPQYFGGLNHSTTRETLLAVGLYDTNFRYYGGEDEDMGFKLRNIGVRLIFGERARTTHYDDISLFRYKVKYMEAGREGLAIMLNKYPEYKDTTNIGWLLPIEFRKDNLNHIFRKFTIQSLLNPAMLKMMEHYAMKTDKQPWAYYPILYRLLTAGWVMQGFKSTIRNVGYVTY